MPGVNVVLKGTTNGTITDVDGNFKLSVPSEGGTLTFSFIGLATEEIEIGARSVIDLAMSADVKQLSEVVVTAQGISREKRSLGYSVTSVGKEALERRPNNDIAQLLNGQVAGVAVTSTSGTAGGGMNMIIRGYSSINGSNQPLFIVDGVPFNTNTNAESGFTGGSLNSSSRSLDIDPNNIAGIEVLKGLSATVLYGEQGRNGVVLITTKGGSAGSGAKGFDISLTQGVFASEIASLPEFQNTYGNGFHQFPAFYFSNWGDNVANVGTVNHPYSNFSDPSLISAFPEFQDGTQYEYKAYDNAAPFFRTGITSQTSLSLSGNTEKSSFSTTLSYINEEGFMPDNSLEKTNIGLGFNTKLTDKLTLNSTLNVALTETTAPPLGASTGSSASGDGSAFYANVLYTPRTVDLNGLPFEHPVDGRSVYYRGGNDIPNPNWLVKYTDANSSVSRLSGKTSLTYDIADNLSITYRGGYDTYYEFQEYIVNKGIGPGPANPVLNSGLYRTTHIRNNIWDHTALANYSKDINEDLNFSILVGANARLDTYKQDGLESTGQNKFGFVEHGNFVNKSSTNSFTGGDIQRQQENNLYAIYSSINLDYKSFLYLNLQGRNDWSSTLEEDRNTIFYPSASVSFIPTSAFTDLESDMLNELKIRVGYGTSAGFASPYSTRNNLAANARAHTDPSGGVFSSNAQSNVLGNPSLVAELHSEIEVGLEAKGWNNRIGLDFSWYKKNTTDLIQQQVGIDPSTGYTSTNINAGEIENTGIEIGLNITPVQTGDFRWDLAFNYFSYTSTVVALAPEFNLDFIQISGFTDFAGNAMIEGEPYGVLWGTKTQRDPDGNRIVSDNGDYIPDAEPGIIGDPTPDFTLNTISTVTWKGVTFGMQWDYRSGGDIFSITAGALPGRGVVDDSYDREPTVILPGVREVGTDGSGNPVYAPNDVQITTTDAFFNNLGFGQTEDRVWDGTNIRLREISLGYALPSSIMEKLPFTGISVSAVASNIWFKSVNFPDAVNFDTDVLGTGVGNGLGLDFLTGPSSRRFGGTIKITF
jgi:TonB-linked SusC/RagA family outer membrane protein